MRPIIVMVVLFSLSIQAKSNEWKVKKLFKDKIEVTYRISERIDETGAKVPLIEDNAVTVDSLSLQKCITFMKDISKHKLFTGDATSQKVRTLSDSAWIVYYYSDNPWPVSNSDCVAIMKFSMNPKEKTALFSFVAAPNEFEFRNVHRMTYYSVTYIFEDRGNGTVKITEKGNSSPPVKVPLWLIKSAFPKAPAKGLRTMVKLIKETAE
jgi:hypothetical protein